MPPYFSGGEVLAVLILIEEVLWKIIKLRIIVYRYVQIKDVVVDHSALVLRCANSDLAGPLPSLQRIGIDAEMA